MMKADPALGLPHIPTKFKLRARRVGPHTVVSLFAGDRIGSLANCGALTLHHDEWEDLLLILSEGGLFHHGAPDRSTITLEKATEDHP